MATSRHPMICFQDQVEEAGVRFRAALIFALLTFMLSPIKFSAPCIHQYFFIPGLYLSSLVSRALLQFIVTKSVVSSSPETLLELVMRWDRAAGRSAHFSVSWSHRSLWPLGSQDIYCPGHSLVSCNRDLDPELLRPQRESPEGTGLLCTGHGVLLCHSLGMRMQYTLAR